MRVKLSLILLTFMILVGCVGGEEGSVSEGGSKLDEESLVELSVDLSEEVFKGNSMEELGAYFDSIKGNISSLAYDNDFNIDVLAVSNRYNFEYDIDRSEFEDVFVEKMEEEGLVNVVVVRKIEYSYGEYIEADLGELFENYVTLVVTFSSESGKIEKMDVYR